jgi:predicted membrane GTPase involved in stress response
VVLSPPIQMSLDDCLEYIADDELVEVSELCFRGRLVGMGTVKQICTFC